MSQNAEKLVHVDTPSRAYDVHVGVGILAEVGAITREAAGGERACIIADSNVWPLYGEKVVAAANAKMAGMDEARWAEAQELADEIIEQLKAAMATGDPAGATAQGLCRTHEAWLRMYWPEGTYSRAAHLGLAHGYLADERFTDYYDSRAGKGATSFLVAALERYCS